MTDEVSIKLPISDKTVVIRNYTTRKDDARAAALVNAGVIAETKSLKDQSVKFSMEALRASQESYIYRLVKSIDGNTENIEAQLDELRTADFELIEQTVEKIVEENSPKVKKAKESAKKASTK